jgi:cytochrome c-type biogenesis protein CcmH
VIALVLAAALAAAPGPTSGADETPLAPDQEERVHRLGKELRCAVCQGLSIADSPAAMARSQLGMVRQLVAQGKTDREIKEYFVARYGEWALLEPPARGVAWLAWALPILVVVAGVGLVVWLSTRRTRPAAAPASAVRPAVAAATAAGEPDREDEDDPYLAAVRREIGH